MWWHGDCKRQGRHLRATRRAARSGLRRLVLCTLMLECTGTGPYVCHYDGCIKVDSDSTPVGLWGCGSRHSAGHLTAIGCGDYVDGIGLGLGLGA